MTRRGGIFLGFGANIDPESNVRAALRFLREAVTVRGLSTVYQTAPLGRPEQPPFLNGVVEIETVMPPLALKRELLRSIEERLGRRRTADKYAPRPIDLDLLLYYDLVMQTEELTLPDPDLERRPFLAVPLLELAPDLMLPGSGRLLREVAGTLDTSGLKPQVEFTEILRRELFREPREGGTSDSRVVGRTG